MIIAFERGTKHSARTGFDLTIEPRIHILNNKHLCRTPPLIKIVYKIKWLICRQAK